MCIRNRLISLIFRIIIIMFCSLGLYLNSGIPNGELAKYMLVFFTIQSNLLCFGYFSVVLFQNIKDLKNKGIYGTTRIMPRFKGGVTLVIAVTFLIYHIVLAPQFISNSIHYNIFTMQNLTVHYIVPILVIVDWLLFDEKLSFKWFDPFIWLSLPIIYFVFILIRAKIGSIIEILSSYYPYFFIDVDLIGWQNVLLNSVAILLAFLALGYSIYFINNIFFKHVSWLFTKVYTKVFAVVFSKVFAKVISKPYQEPYSNSQKAPAEVLLTN